MFSEEITKYKVGDPFIYQEVPSSLPIKTFITRMTSVTIYIMGCDHSFRSTKKQTVFVSNKKTYKYGRAYPWSQEKFDLLTGKAASYIRKIKLGEENKKKKQEEKEKKYALEIEETKRAIADLNKITIYKNKLEDGSFVTILLLPVKIISIQKKGLTEIAIIRTVDAVGEEKDVDIFISYMNKSTKSFPTYRTELKGNHEEALWHGINYCYHNK